MSSKPMARPPESGQRHVITPGARLLAWLHDTPDQSAAPQDPDPPRFARGVTEEHRFDAHAILTALASALLRDDAVWALDQLPDIRKTVEGPPLGNYVHAIQTLSAEAKSREQELARVKHEGLDPTRAITALDRHYRLIPPYLWQFDANFRSLQLRYVRSRLLAIGAQGNGERIGPLHVAAEFILAVRAFGHKQRPGEDRAQAQARILGWLRKWVGHAGG
jgi:hypothetical protein